MRRVLFTWRDIRIHSYPAMLYLGLVVGMTAGNYAANLAGLDSARVLVVMLLLIAPALIGARLLFVATEWHQYRSEPKRIWRRTEGGMSLLGGLPLIIAGSVPLLAVLRVPFGQFWDVTIFTILITMVFTRIGCLLHGCCCGRASAGPLALYLPDEAGRWQRRIPSQLLEAGLAVVLLLGAVMMWRARLFPGAVFWTATVGYMLGRYALQSTRATQEHFGALNVQRALSVAFALIALAVLFTGWIDTH